MIDIVTLDEDGHPIHHRVLKAPRPRGRAILLTLSMSVGDPIFIRPDWPPIGSPDFAARLRAWHEQHNPKPIDVSEAE